MMRVGFGVAMTREMLHRRKHAVILERQGICSAFTSNIIRIFAETTESDHRIVWFVVDINIRSEIDVDTDSNTLLSDLATHFRDERIVGYCAQCHLIRI